MTQQNRSNRIVLSRGRGPSARIVTAQETSFARLARHVATFKAEKLATKSKNESEWFSIAKYRDERRHSETLTEAYAVTLDSDSGTLTEPIIRDALKGFSYFAYTSYSHSEGKPKWRIVVELS